MRSGIGRTIWIALMFLAVSCSASRNNGFSYRPAHSGPDVAGTSGSDIQTESVVHLPEPPVSPSFPTNGLEETNTIAADLGRIVEEQAPEIMAAEKLDVRKTVTGIAEAYSSEKNIQLTPKQWRKLDKYAAKLERKQQRNADVDWGPQNNLEIFLLAAAGVGLIVGFFSGIGWVVFLAAALVYLYLKLLKN